DAYKVATKNVAAEIGTLCGPQLVAPLSDAQAVLEAANARWGSLYDALASPAAIASGSPDTIARGRALLDAIAPLESGSHAETTGYVVELGRLEAIFVDGSRAGLRAPDRFAGFTGPRHEPKSLLLVNNGL